MTHIEVLIACRPDAPNTLQRARYQAVRRELGASLRDTRELENGYAFAHPADEATLARLAEFIALERRCCPFLRFTLDVTGTEDTLWLELTGSGAAKRVVAAEFLSAAC